MDFSKHSGHIVLTDDVHLLMLATAAATITMPCETYIFANDDAGVPGSIPDPASYIKSWMSDLFERYKTAPKIVVFAPGHCRKVPTHEMFEFIGWLPQLEVNLVCVCDPSHAAGLPEWEFQLSPVSEADYVHALNQAQLPRPS